MGGNTMSINSQRDNDYKQSKLKESPGKKNIDNNNNSIQTNNPKESIVNTNKELIQAPNRSEPLSDNAAKFQHYLKYLYKNNFVSLTYDDLYAFMIQYHWRRYFIEKIRLKKRGIIDVIYTSLNFNPNITSHISNTFLILESKKYPFRCYDLMDHKLLAKVIEPFGGSENLPAIFINGYYIGSYDQIQELEDMKLINRIINSDYLTECLICHISKMNPELDTCPYCFKEYLFFSLSNLTKYDIPKCK